MIASQYGAGRASETCTVFGRVNLHVQCVVLGKRAMQWKPRPSDALSYCRPTRD